MTSEWFYRLILAVFMSAAIGAQREHNLLSRERPVHLALGGVRTFGLVGLLGYLSYYSYSLGLAIILPIVLTGLLLLLIAGYYKSPDSLGFTTELAFVIAFFIGLLCGRGELYASAFIMIVTVTVLAIKVPVRRWLTNITDTELNTVTKFGIITVVVLPLLPESLNVPADIAESFAWLPFHVINPREIWLVVILVSGIGFVGYILSRIWGSKRGLLLAAFTGGLVSSTAVTMNYARRSTQSVRGQDIYLAAGILTACLIMFPRMFFEAAVFSPEMAIRLLIPFTVICITGAGYIYYLFRQKPNTSTEGVEIKLLNPFSLREGFFFGLLYLGVKIFAWYGQEYFGSAGLYSVALISGLSDVDAITINMARSAREGMDVDTATLTVYLAAVSNTVVKAGYVAVLARGNFSKKVLPGLGIMLLAGSVYFIF